jgi:dienelactone hydrolase
MRYFTIIIAALALTSALTSALATSAGAQETVHLWPNGQPGHEDRKDLPESAADWWVRDINNPSLTVFRPDAAKNTGTAVIVVPGGGHQNLVFNAEGVAPAKFLQDLGVTAFALKYVLARQAGSPYTIEGDAQADLLRAVRYVRAHAAEYGVDPARIGVMGFSAGGELTSMVAFNPQTPDPHAADPVDRLSARPDFLIEIYPGPLGIPPIVDKAPPPAFLLNAYDDKMAVMDTNVIQDMYGMYPDVPLERHILSGGRHGFNMGERSGLKAVRDWPQRLADWLGDQGWLRKP